MLNEIKNRLEGELKNYLAGSSAQARRLNSISPVLYRHVKEFLLRQGKRVRPTLFILGYLGYCRKPVIRPGLFRSAISFELLHAFLLAHDDVIDKTDTRRGRPALHKEFNQYLARYKNLKFNGQDLAIVAGDIIYTMAIEAFLALEETPKQKETALRKFLAAAFYTGGGEFLELLYGAKIINELKESGVYKIYDLKTANYTFASPLAIGAAAAGAVPKETGKLFKYGILIGRAFQIKDDILGMFSEERETGKSSISDLREAKKTILILKAYENSPLSRRRTIEKIFLKNNAGREELLLMRKIITESGSLDYAKNQIQNLLSRAEKLLKAASMKPHYKFVLGNYAKKITGYKKPSIGKPASV